MANDKYYDRKEAFKEHCEPYLQQLRSFCIIYGIPMYFTACIKNSESGSEYINEASFPESIDVHLTDDRIKKHMLVGLGFDVVPNRVDLDISEVFDSDI